MQAPVEQRIIRECAREGLPLPKKIANAPSLQLGLQLYYLAFWDLASCRPIGFGMAPLPWTVVEQYGRLLALDEEQMQSLHFFIREMDGAYMEWASSKE